MLLKSFGCSFVYGTDLADDPNGFGKKPSSQLTWPALLAKQFNWDYECFAKPGIGNLQILARLLDSLAVDQPAFFVVAWTWIDRFDYIHDTNGQWQTVRPNTDCQKSDLYYRNFHSELKDKLSTLMAIKLAIDALNQKSHGFLMTYMDNLIFDTQWNVSPAIQQLQQDVRPWLHNWEGKNFLEWSKQRGYEVSSGWHPKELAHHASAKLLEKYVMSTQNLSKQD
jgi:hypothetical protein